MKLAPGRRLMARLPQAQRAPLPPRCPGRGRSLPLAVVSVLVCRRSRSGYGPSPSPCSAVRPCRCGRVCGVMMGVVSQVGSGGGPDHKEQRSPRVSSRAVVANRRSLLAALLTCSVNSREDMSKLHAFENSHEIWTSLRCRTGRGNVHTEGRSGRRPTPPESAMHYDIARFWELGLTLDNGSGVQVSQAETPSPLASPILCAHANHALI